MFRDLQVKYNVKIDTGMNLAILEQQVDPFGNNKVSQRNTGWRRHQRGCGESDYVGCCHFTLSIARRHCKDLHRVVASTDVRFKRLTLAIGC